MSVQLTVGNCVGTPSNDLDYNKYIINTYAAPKKCTGLTPPPARRKIDKGATAKHKVSSFTRSRNGYNESSLEDKDNYDIPNLSRIFSIFGAIHVFQL
ncbi:MAG: hypothetical protein SYR96_39730 [Actinomycetota bacterium]|nr:hypothetical protein [Actinomycetota bacterium]